MVHLYCVLYTMLRFFYRMQKYPLESRNFYFFSYHSNPGITR
jgi:hypothetical protein